MSISSSSAGGGGGGGASVFPLGLSAGLSAGFPTGLVSAAGAGASPDPKKSVTLLPLSAFATALMRVLLAVRFAALRTALRESEVTSAPAPLRMKAA